ncbi:MAG: DUF1640 domain-containing protein, partial [Bacteroidetes bacterium]|nr:DUF1640 domain-containing protein [Bacteroidota bacterium]
AQIHAEVITTAVNGALEKAATKEFVISQIAELRAEMQTGFAELRTEMQTGLAELRTEMQTGLAELRTEMQTGLAELRTEMQTGLAELRTEMQTVNAETRTENKASELRQLRWIVGTIVAIGSLQIAAQFFA